MNGLSMDNEQHEAHMIVLFEQLLSVATPTQFIQFKFKSLRIETTISPKMSPVNFGSNVIVFKSKLSSLSSSFRCLFVLSEENA